MAMSPGTRLGSYEITALIGAGGMGEVYRATDTNLRRQVAIKVLPEAMARDGERLARFQREAEVLAALNHPHIAQIYGLERGGGQTALVMELVEGPTLADRIAQGPLPVEEALPIATQIAEALAAAHEQGIVHRDLKPANVKLRPDGTVKVLDFGLAKPVQSAGPAAITQSISPIITSPAATQAGVILGTAAYMAPEQARGHAAGRSSDVWAFGCVLFEMLSGRAAFGGETVSDVLGAILKTEPEWTALPAGTPPALRLLLERCLRKDRRRRPQDAGDVRIALEEARESPASAAISPRAPRPMVWIAAAAVLAAALSGIVVWRVTRAETPPAGRVTRLALLPPDGTTTARVLGGEVAISRDGSRVAFLARRPSGPVSVFVRDLATLDARPVPASDVPPLGTGLTPFFSLDGSAIAFRTAEGIQQMPLTGGPATRLIDNPRAFFQADWHPDGRLLYSLGNQGVFVRPAAGGEARRVTPAPEAGVFYVLPSFLPDGRRALVTLLRAPSESLLVLDLDTGEQRPVIAPARRGVYTATGHLVFQRGSTLMAAPFDAAAAKVTGDAVPIVEGVDESDWALSADGTLVYLPAVAAGSETSSIRRIDRSGRVLGSVAEKLERPVDLRISPAGDRVAVSTGVITQQKAALWVYDLAGRPPIPLLQNAGVGLPVWSPTGDELAIQFGTPGQFGAYRLRADGSSDKPARIDTGAVMSWPNDWPSPTELFVDTPENIRVVSPDGAAKPRDIVTTTRARGQGSERLSPGGRWMAYLSDRTGSLEVWVTPVRGGAPVRVSEGGGQLPVWSRDGRQLFYWKGRFLMAATVKLDGPSFVFNPATPLFEVEADAAGAAYDVLPNGEFLMVRPDEKGPGVESASGLIVVQNWFEELRQRVPLR